MDFSRLGLAGLFVAMLLAGCFVPVSGDVVYAAFAGLYQDRLTAILMISVLGNWAGCMVTYFCGRLASWAWVEKTFKITREKLERQKEHIDRYGIFMGLVAWLPVIGQVFLVALGFYKSRAVPTAALILAGCSLRFLLWTLIFA